METQANDQGQANRSGNTPADQSRNIVVPQTLRDELGEALEAAETTLDAFAEATKLEASGMLCQSRSAVTNQDRRLWEAGNLSGDAFGKFAARTRLTISTLGHLSDVPEEAWRPISGLCSEAGEQLDKALEAVEKAVGQ